MSSAPHPTPPGPPSPPSPPSPDSTGKRPAVLEPMRQLYDRYFASHDYQRRYPRPNQSTLAAIYRAGAKDARSILDVGCGHGRYILALLPNTQARIVACDISAVALQQLQHSLQTPPYAAWAERVQCHHGTAQQLPLQPRHDVLLLLFGVLSHAGYRADRLALLQALHQRASPAARLVLSVPSRWRRRPWELLLAQSQHLFSSLLTRLRRALHGTPAPTDASAEAGTIHFRRSIDGHTEQFFYHLYTLRELRQDLQDTGWQLLQAEPESLLPEWLISQHPGIERLDTLLQRLLPAALGYGIRVTGGRSEG